MRQITYKTFKHDYIAYCNMEKRPTTVLRESAALSAFEKYAPCPLERITQITPKLLGEVKNVMRLSGKGPHGINRNIRGVKTAMRWAEIRYDLHRQDWSQVKQLPVVENRELWYSAEELRRLLDLSPQPYKTAIYLGARCGLRPTEIYHAKEENFDTVRRLLRVTGTDCNCHECLVVGGYWRPKNRQSDRSIPLEGVVYAHIQALPQGQTWLLGDPRPSPAVFRTTLTGLIRQAGLRGSPYTLRHTFASHLVMAGVPLKKVSVLMGHKSQSMTERYAHLAPDHMRDETSRLPSLIAQGPDLDKASVLLVDLNGLASGPSGGSVRAS